MIDSMILFVKNNITGRYEKGLQELWNKRISILL